MSMHPPAKSLLLTLCLFASNTMAISFADLPNQDASSGLKAALEKGSVAAVANSFREKTSSQLSVAPCIGGVDRAGVPGATSFWRGIVACRADAPLSGCFTSRSLWRI